MTQQSIKKVKHSKDEESFSSDSKNIIDEYKELNDKVDSVLEKISARKNKKERK